MGGHRVIVRILGVSSTTRGFAFAVTEGPRRLVNWELRRVPARAAAMVKSLDVILRRMRPLFVAFEGEASVKKRRRGQMVTDAVTNACDAHGIMILSVRS